MSYVRQSILFINGLDKSVNENMLYTLFNDYSISYIKIAKDHNTRESFGYAFIGFKNHQKAEEAIKKLNYSKLAKKTLRISWYNREPNNFRDHPEFNIFVKRIAKEVSAREFAEHFGQFGNIISAKLAEDEEGESMGYGFVLYDSEEAAKKAIAETHEKEWRGKKLFVCQFEKNRPKKPLRYNNIYVRNIPKSWDDEKIRNYFSKYGEIGSMLVKEADPNTLNKALPEEKRKQILEHKYAFVCFKSLDGPAKNAVAKVPYLKYNDDEYNKKIEGIVGVLKTTKEVGIILGDENWYKCADYIDDNTLNEQIKEAEECKKICTEFKKKIDENDGVYLIKDKKEHLECCQALKKAEREKKLKQLYEKIKKRIKEKYKFCNLYVKNLPDNYTDDDLKTLFGEFGSIRSAKVVKKEIVSNYLGFKKSIKVFGYVCFFEPEKAADAKKGLKDKMLVPETKLYVDYHQTKQERSEFLKLKLIKDSERRQGKPMMMMGPGRMPMLMPRYPPQRMPGFTGPMMPPMNMQMMQMPQQQFPPANMTKAAAKDFYGEQLFSKISNYPMFKDYSTYFSKIVGIFIELEDNVVNKLLTDNSYFERQVNETIKLLTQKDKQ